MGDDEEVASLGSAQTSSPRCTCALKRAFTNAEARAPLLEKVSHSGAGFNHLCSRKALPVILSTAG